MILPFKFSTAKELMFGRGESRHLPDRTLALGSKVLLVCGSRGVPESINLENTPGIKVVSVLNVVGEPSTTQFEDALVAARASKADVVVGVGGGSVLDTAKALAALVPARTKLFDHLEVVGAGKPLGTSRLPLILVPTTAGTGSEVTRNAVIEAPENSRKVSLRDEMLLPDLAIVDSALTDNTPKDVTLYSGLDAITQVIEPYLCTRSNPLTDAICFNAIPRGLMGLKQLMEGECRVARDELAWVSLCGGLALANSGLGVVHGIAGPLGGLSGAPHGAICGALLAESLIANSANVTDPLVKNRFKQVEQWISEVFDVPSYDAFPKLKGWIGKNGLTGLSLLGITAGQIECAAIAASSSSSMQANPVRLSSADLLRIMRRCL